MSSVLIRDISDDNHQHEIHLGSHCVSRHRMESPCPWTKKQTNGPFLRVRTNTKILRIRFSLRLRSGYCWASSCSGFVWRRYFLRRFGRIRSFKKHFILHIIPVSYQVWGLKMTRSDSPTPSPDNQRIQIFYFYTFPNDRLSFWSAWIRKLSSVNTTLSWVDFQHSKR